MMATKPKPVMKTIPTTKPEDAVEELERRLLALGGSDNKAAPAEPIVKPVMNTPAPVVAPMAAAPVVTAAPASNGSAKGGGKNALLARIMAAQERAKMEQKKPEPAVTPADAASEQERIMKTLSGIDPQPPAPAPLLEEKKSNDPPPPSFNVAEKNETPPPFEVAEKTPAPPPFEVAEETAAPPPFEAVEELPPPFEVAETNTAPAPPPPPPFEVAESTPTLQPSAPPSAPTAPPVDLLDLHSSAPPTTNLDGLQPLVPPSESSAPVAPPSFEQFEEQTQNDGDAFEYDLDGNKLSEEERKAMMEEQRRILEQIQKETSGNAAAIAQAAADGFDSRSASAAARAVDPQPTIIPVGVGDVGGAVMAAADASEPVERGLVPENSRGRGSRTVEIGGGQNVALHGQERTKAAIAEGTAILVQCINCENWMQVTETATLMFCPVCSVVSPVQKQNQVMTKEEAIQLTNDRKLAEQLQKEIDDSERGVQANQEEDGGGSFLSRLTGTTSSSSSSGATRTSRPQPKSSSWWDTVSNMVSFGVQEDEAERRATRPPGATQSTSPSTRAALPGQGALHGVNTGEAAPIPTNERQGLLMAANTDGDVVQRSSPSLPSARIAEQKPLFSCVVDSMSNVATALTSTTLSEDAEGNVHGVDSSSLLVTTAGRSGNGNGGDYQQLSKNESM